jgi:hypothetical protein
MVHSLSAGGVGYVAVLHAQLFDLQPVLAFLPIFVIGLVVHFFIRSKSAATGMAGGAESGTSGHVHPLLSRDAKVIGNADEDGDIGAVVALRSPVAQSHKPQHLRLDLGGDDPGDSSSHYSSPVDDDDGDDSDDGDGELEPGYVMEWRHEFDGGVEDEEDFFPVQTYRHRTEKDDYDNGDYDPSYENRFDLLSGDNYTSPRRPQSSGSSSNYNSLSDVELQGDGN